MTPREVAFALALLVAGAWITYGVFQLSASLGHLAGGALVAVGSWIVLSE